MSISLTPTERQIAGLIAEGRTNPGVASTLGVSTKTLEWHLSGLYRKFGVTTRRELEIRIENEQEVRQ